MLVYFTILGHNERAVCDEKRFALRGLNFTKKEKRNYLIFAKKCTVGCTPWPN